MCVLLEVRTEYVNIIYSCLLPPPYQKQVLKRQQYVYALIRITTYVCPAWDFVADIHLLELQRLKNMFLRTIGYLPTHTHTDPGTACGFQYPIPI
jgi:hypothetical protein